MSDQKEVPLTEASPSVQAHLQILQSVIQRMAGNSASCKTWCITVVSALLLIVADQGKPEFAHITLIPTFLFLALDGYYLGLEKAFRASYTAFVRKLHSGVARAADLYAVEPAGSRLRHQVDALKAFSVWGFYLTLFVLIEVIRMAVLK